MGTAFRNVPITYFDEFQFFVSVKGVYAGTFTGAQLVSITFPEGLTTLGGGTFSSSTVQRIVLPSSLTSIGQRAFYISSCSVAIIKATVPPSITVDHYSSLPRSIYVPDDSVDAYKTASVWSDYASRIYPISEFDDQEP